MENETFKCQIYFNPDISVSEETYDRETGCDFCAFRTENADKIKVCYCCDSLMCKKCRGKKIKTDYSTYHLCKSEKCLDQFNKSLKK